MNTLLFIHANCCDVQIVETICETVALMTIIIAIIYFLIQLSGTILDWKKSKLTTAKEVRSEDGKTPDPKEEVRKLEMQRQEKAKALVKDFYEMTKDLTTAEKLMKLYETVLGYSSNSTNNDTDGKEQ